MPSRSAGATRRWAARQRPGVCLGLDCLRHQLAGERRPRKRLLATRPETVAEETVSACGRRGSRWAVRLKIPPDAQDHPIYEERRAGGRSESDAAAAAARGLPFPFTLTARAENYLQGRPDLRGIRSSGCRLFRKQARMSCTHRAWPRRTTLPPWSARRSPGQRPGGSRGHATDHDGTGGDRSQAPERGQRALPSGPGRVSSRRSRNAGARQLCVYR